MRNIFYISFTCLILLSCSKEEDIPFKESVKDSIDVTSYTDISGTYHGIMSRVNFVGPGLYTKGSGKEHVVEVSEISFDKVLVKNYSSDVSGDAEAEMFRYNQKGGYLMFLQYSMPDSTGVDSVYGGQFNGEFTYKHDSLSYFVHYIKNSDTIHQIFEGEIK